MNKYVALALFVALSLGGGLVIGMMNTPAEWYAALTKPSFNPPNWVFGPVWTVLYIFIGVAGWRIWSLAGTGALQRVWWVQMALNFAWSPIFFTAQNLGLALMVIVPLLAVIVTFIFMARRIDAVSAWLFVPYAVWVGFATCLNAALFWLN